MVNLPDGVMVAQRPLEPLVMVRIHVGQPGTSLRLALPGVELHLALPEAELCLRRVQHCIRPEAGAGLCLPRTH